MIATGWKAKKNTCLKAEAFFMIFGNVIKLSCNTGINETEMEHLSNIVIILCQAQADFVATSHIFGYSG